MRKGSLNRSKGTLGRTSDRVSISNLVEDDRVSLGSLIDDRVSISDLVDDSDDETLPKVPYDRRQTANARERQQDATQDVKRADVVYQSYDGEKTPHKASERPRTPSVAKAHAVSGAKVKPTYIDGAYDQFGDTRDRVYQGLIVTAIGVMPYFLMAEFAPDAVCKMTTTPYNLALVPIAIVLTLIGTRMTPLFRCNLWKSLTTPRPTMSRNGYAVKPTKHHKRHKRGQFVSLPD